MIFRPRIFKDASEHVTVKKTVTTAYFI